MFKAVLSEWKRNVAPPIWSKKRNKFIPNSRYPVWKPLCSYVRKMVHGRIRTNYDLHFVQEGLTSAGSSDVAFYVLKYMMKPSNREKRLQQALHLNLDSEEYEAVWKIVRSRSFASEGFGLGTSSFHKVGMHRIYDVPEIVLQHLRKGIDLSFKNDEPIPSFFSPVDGSSHPLAKYYKNRGEIFTQDDFINFFYSSKLSRADNVVITEAPDNQTDQKIEKFVENVSLVEFSQSVSDLDDLFEF